MMTRPTCHRRIALGPVCSCFTLLLASLLFLLACHEAPRNNPFDPALTPPVELAVALDDTAGTATLTWSPYAGEQPFAQYRVLRQVRGLVAVDTVARIADLRQTTYQDTALQPEQTYLYRVEVVNRAGLPVSSPEVLAGSFSVAGVELAGEVQADGLQGALRLRWQRYHGPDFDRYEVWRRSYGEESQRLSILQAVGDTAWTDTTALPGKVYTYWLRLLAAGRALESRQREGRYELPGIELQPVRFSSATATAELHWSRYPGPRFAAYEVRRRGAEGGEIAVAEIGNLDRTSYTDSLLDGNTEYGYRLFVRTTWGQETGTFSQERRGRFYGLEQTIKLPPSAPGSLGTTRVQAIGLAVDEEDRLFAAATAVYTTTAQNMVEGIQVRHPETIGYRSYFAPFTPDRLSPLQMAVNQGRLYLAVKAQGDSLLVGMLQGQQEGWSTPVEAGGAFPAGLFPQAEGGVQLVDTQGVLYYFAAAGELVEKDLRLQEGLEGDQALPLRQMVGPGIEEMFYLLAPERGGNHLIGRMRIPLGVRQIFAGTSFVFDDGVGSENGQTLSPLVLAFDRSRGRLVVLEAQGRLQVLDARDGVPRHYITKWGRFGRGQGEFQVSPSVAVALAVDAQGRIYVADGEVRVQVFVP